MYSPVVLFPGPAQTSSTDRSRVLRRLRERMRGAGRAAATEESGPLLGALGVAGRMFDVRTASRPASLTDGGRTLAAALLAERCGPDGRGVWIDDRQTSMPALAGLGCDGGRTLRVNPADNGETLWACEQALRSGAVRAVVAVVGDAGATDLRRLAVASEQTATLLVLLRPMRASNGSWADARLVVRRTCGEDRAVWRPRIRVDIPYCRGAGDRPPVMLTWGDCDDAQPVVSRLADPARAAGRTRAAPRLQLSSAG